MKHPLLNTYAASILWCRANEMKSIQATFLRIQSALFKHDIAFREFWFSHIVLNLLMPHKNRIIECLRESLLSVDEKPDDDKDDGRVLIRGSSLRPTIRNWRKFEIDEKSGNTSTLISLPVLTATVPHMNVLAYCCGTFWVDCSYVGFISGCCGKFWVPC